MPEAHGLDICKDMLGRHQRFALFLEASLSIQGCWFSSLVPEARQTAQLATTAIHLLHLILTELIVQYVQ